MRSVMMAAAAVWMAAGQALAADAPPAKTAVPPPPAMAAPAASPAGAALAPMGLSRIVVRLPMGQEYGQVRGGGLCLGSQKLTWKSGQVDLHGDLYVRAFHDAMVKAGLNVAGDPDNLFEHQASFTDYEVAGVITNMYLNVCQPRIGFRDVSTIHGAALVDMQWQVYSTLRKTVVATIETHGTYETKDNTTGGTGGLILEAIRDNLGKLAVDPKFRAVFTAGPPAPGDLVKPSSQAAIALIGAITARARPVADAAGSVVVIFAGSGEGSGFLVSSDGLLLTDQHVVGEAKFVKVRWADGIEGLGEVVRSDKVRDVALVKTDSRGRAPLELRRVMPQVGDTVYAIGAPLGEKFQSSVTRGVVSADRTFQGLAYIQSDVSVNPGSSGGPLLDEKGEVVALTEAGVRIGGAPEGVNLFTPVGDALDFLGAQLK
jgi:S1-C subfamily serine protease